MDVGGRSLAALRRSHIARLPGWTLGSVAAGAVAWLLLQTAAARRFRPAGASSEHPGLVVLVPAHDEAAGIEATIASLQACAYPEQRRRIVVIADNCHDATPAIARTARATVWERDAPEKPGKGAALAWAIKRVVETWPSTQGIVVVDADCLVSENLLAALAGHLAAGADAVQARYEISNPEESSATALRFAGFALMNTIRPRGRQALGLSAGLLGTGMAFDTRTLERLPWTAFSITEDREYHLRMLERGMSVVFADDASVRSSAPSSAAGADTQQTRWDAGNFELARRWGWRLARAPTASPRQRVGAITELLVPPQSALAALTLATGAWGLATASRGLVGLGLAASGGQAVYVLAGLITVGAPRVVFLALLRAPLLVARRSSQLVGILRGRGPTSWQRTERSTPGAGARRA